MSENKRLGEAKISKLLLEFSVPCVMGLLISALYNIVDQIFIGNSELGYLGNAATGISFPIICIANAFAWCVGDGAASFLSICAGRKDSQSAHKSVGTGITVSFLISVAFMLLCLAFRTPLMRLFGASDQTLGMAVEYFTIVAAFFPFYLLLNVMNSMIRADGSPSFAMAAMAVGAVINIILDPVFIFLLKWGIAGAAWATVIGQVVSFLVNAVYFFRPKSFQLTRRSFIPDLGILRTMVSLGAATFVTQIALVVSLTCNVMLAKYGALSKFGPDIPISVFSIQTKVYTVVYSVFTGIVLGGQPIFGYNYGAQKMDRVRETHRLVIIYSIVVCLIATFLFQFFPLPLLNLFGADGGALYQEFGALTFRVYLSLIIFTALTKVTAVFFQSIGKSGRAVAASLVRDILCLTPLAILLPAVMEAREPGSGIYGILLAAPIADVMAMVVVIVLTVSFFRSLKKTGSAPAEAAPSTVIRPSTPGTIITIAREHGSMGKQVGKLVAQKLDIPFYYKEMTALAAQESGLDREFISSINENSPSYLHDLYLSTTVIRQAVTAQERIIRKIADHGRCVIVGRAADYVLRDNTDIVRVFLHAPKKYRIGKIMEMYGDDRDAAAANVRRSDAARSAYYRSISGRSWEDPHNYDLCIDASIGKEECAELICQYIASRKKS
ncbi:MAG: MATE family efflux transporter [Oscillibacter sp.]|nr:MATE family efflux transporter [Oscillibacter sp.]